MAEMKMGVPQNQNGNDSDSERGEKVKDPLKTMADLRSKIEGAHTEVQKQEMRLQMWQVVADTMPRPLMERVGDPPLPDRAKAELKSAIDTLSWVSIGDTGARLSWHEHVAQLEAKLKELKAKEPAGTE